MPLNDEQARQVIEDYRQAWNAKNPQALVDRFTDAGTYSDPRAGQKLTGDAIRDYARAVWAAFPDFSLTTVIVHVISSEEGLVVHRWQMHGTNTGPLPDGSPATSHELNLSGIDVIQVAGNRIRSVNASYDLQSVHLQLGTPTGGVTGALNVKEALGFLKDWVTALIAVEAAAIGAFVAFLPQIGNYHHWQRWLLGLTLFCLGSSLWCGWNVLYMLPGCAQRKPDPNNDIYSLRTIDQPLEFWVRRFWYLFMASAVCILAFYSSKMGFEFLRVTLVVAIVISAIYIDWRWQRIKAESQQVQGVIVILIIVIVVLAILAPLILPRLPVTDAVALAVSVAFFIAILISVRFIDWSQQHTWVENRAIFILIVIVGFAIIVSFVLPRLSVTKDAWNEWMASALQPHDKAEYLSNIQASLGATSDKSTVLDDVSKLEALANKTELDTGVPEIVSLAIASGLALEEPAFCTTALLVRDVEDVMAVNRKSFDCDTALAISRQIAAMIKTKVADLGVLRLLELSPDELAKFDSAVDRAKWIHNKISSSTWHGQASVQFRHAVPQNDASLPAPCD